MGLSLTVSWDSAGTNPNSTAFSANKRRVSSGHGPQAHRCTPGQSGGLHPDRTACDTAWLGVVVQHTDQPLLDVPTFGAGHRALRRVQGRRHLGSAPAPEGHFFAYRLSNPARHGHSGPLSSYLRGCLASPSSLFYGSRAKPVRLPLPIIPSVNTRAHRFGGIGFSYGRIHE